MDNVRALEASESLGPMAAFYCAGKIHRKIYQLSTLSDG